MTREVGGFLIRLLLLSDAKLAEKLNGIRNGLVHALSHDSDIIFVCKISEARENPQSPQKKWYLGIVEFVEAVHITANSLIAKHPSAVFDSKTGRAPSEGSSVPWGSSASGRNLSESDPPTQNFGRKII